MSFLNKVFSFKDKIIEDPEILLEEKSPACPIIAVVEQYNDVVFFYLWSPADNNFNVKKCWVRNLCDIRDVKIKTKENADILNTDSCLYPQGQEKLKAEELSIVWNESGDGAALLKHEDVLAIITSNRQVERYAFARDCKKESNLCLPLIEHLEFLEQVKTSRLFWENILENNENYYRYCKNMLDDLEQEIGQKNYLYNLWGEDEGFPRVNLFVRVKELSTTFCTVGMSYTPIPKNNFTDTIPDKLELAFAIKQKLSKEEIAKVTDWIAGIATFPWAQITCIMEGQIFSFHPLEEYRFNRAILVKNRPVFYDRYKFLPSKTNDYQRLLTIPITDNEYLFAKKYGGLDLIELMIKSNVDLFDIEREEVV